MIDLPNLDEASKFRLTELHRLTVETHAAVVRMEATGSSNHEVLSRIEANTATVAQFFQKFESLAQLAAGKNQIPISLVVVLAVLLATYFISDNLRTSLVDVKIPWLGLSIEHHKAAPNSAGAGQ